MSGLKLDVQGDVAKVIKANELLRTELLKASARALNRTADNVRAAAVKEIAQRERIKQADVRKYVNVSVRANYTGRNVIKGVNAQGASSLSATVTANGKAPNLIEFVDKASRYPAAWRGGAGVAAHVMGVTTVREGSFIVRARNGKMVVVSRSYNAKNNRFEMRPKGQGGKWKKGWSKGLYGPPPPRTFANRVVMDTMDRLARIRWPINWKHESERVIKGGGK